MAVDYTKVFTIIGSYIGKVDAYYAYIEGFTVDQGTIETILSAQDVIPLGDGLTDDYDTAKQSISDIVGLFINRAENVLTDDELIGQNFNFGSIPSVNQALLTIIHDMGENSQTVQRSTITVGSPTYDTENTTVGLLKTSTILDGFTPPFKGAFASPDYYLEISELAPDAETLSFVCTRDSETGGIRGSEVFSVKGTGAGSGPYSIEGENVGTLSSLTVADNTASLYATNLSFDSSTATGFTGWDIDTGVFETDFDVDADSLYGSGTSIIINANMQISQVLTTSRFNRRQAFWLSAWAKKETDADVDDNSIVLKLSDSNGVYDDTLTITPTSTDWEHFSAQVLIPVEIVGDLVLTLLADDFTEDDSVIIDQIVITPCTYIAGVAIAIFGGPEKWLLGDEIQVEVSNNNVGIIQTYFRKAHRCQLPSTAGTPTLSDELVT